MADLSGIGGHPGDLFVSNVIHKAFVEVNEEGTKQETRFFMFYCFPYLEVNFALWQRVPLDEPHCTETVKNLNI